MALSIADRVRAGASKFLEGLEPIDPEALADYEREMAEEAIPAIVRDVERRRTLAVEARQRRLVIPAPA